MSRIGPAAARVLEGCADGFRTGNCKETTWELDLDDAAMLVLMVRSDEAPKRDKSLPRLSTESTFLPAQTAGP